MPHSLPMKMMRNAIPCNSVVLSQTIVNSCSTSGGSEGAHCSHSVALYPVLSLIGYIVSETHVLENVFHSLILRSLHLEPVSALFNQIQMNKKFCEAVVVLYVVRNDKKYIGGGGILPAFNRPKRSAKHKFCKAKEGRFWWSCSKRRREVDCIIGLKDQPSTSFLSQTILRY